MKNPFEYKLKHVNKKRAHMLLPDWVVDVDLCAETIDKLLVESGLYEANEKFWIEIDVSSGRAEIKTPDEMVNNQCVVIFYNAKSLLGAPCQIEIPVYELTCTDKESSGEYQLYYHAFHTDVPVAYWGITKNGWVKRLRQHLTTAKSGSGYAFHDAIRRHGLCATHHHILLANLNFETAMHYEEEFVRGTLYPMGLNMIPGGHAGLKYLAKHGMGAKTLKQRDSAIASILKMKTINGKPNPLCAARWASDQDYINRVVCGHSGRLTVKQVQVVKALARFDYTDEEIMGVSGVEKKHQVKNIRSGKRYSKVK